MAIENIIFDIGGVLIQHDPEPFISSMEISPEEKNRLSSILREPDLFLNLDLGIFDTFMDALDDICERHPEDKRNLHDFFTSGFMEKYTLATKGAGILHDLKMKGYGIYLLSNFSKDGIETLKKNFSFFDDVDGMLISSNVHLVKPDRRIYRLMIEKFDFFADECLFLDDRLENVLSAREVGFNSIVYSEKTIDDELKRYL